MTRSAEAKTFSDAVRMLRAHAEALGQSGDAEGREWFLMAAAYLGPRTAEDPAADPVIRELSELDTSDPDVIAANMGLRSDNDRAIRAGDWVITTDAVLTEHRGKGGRVVDVHMGEAQVALRDGPRWFKLEWLRPCVEPPEPRSSEAIPEDPDAPSEDVARMVHAFGDIERKMRVRHLAERVRATEDELRKLRRERAIPETCKLDVRHKGPCALPRAHKGQCALRTPSEIIEQCEAFQIGDLLCPRCLTPVGNEAHDNLGDGDSIVCMRTDLPPGRAT